MFFFARVAWRLTNTLRRFHTKERWEGKQVSIWLCVGVPPNSRLLMLSSSNTGQVKKWCPRWAGGNPEVEQHMMGQMSDRTHQDLKSCIITSWEQDQNDGRRDEACIKIFAPNYRGLSTMGPDLNTLHNLFRCYHLVVNCMEHVMYRLNCTVSYMYYVHVNLLIKYSINQTPFDLWYNLTNGTPF